MEEEQYIDLKDIEILDEELDEDYNPSDEEIFAYAEYLGFDLENDQELLIIAYQALKTPLPPNWKRAIIKNSQEVLYINLEDQTLHTYSPIDEAAIIHYREQKEMLCKQAKSGSESNNNNKVIPRAKNLPPIEKGEGKNNKKDKFSLGSNFPKETKEEQQHQNILNENKKENETGILYYYNLLY